MITRPGNIQAQLRDKADNNVWDLVGSGVPTNGTSGTGVDLAGPGSTYFDYTNGVAYVNQGTKTSPVWLRLSPVTGEKGLGLIGNAKATYDFAVDGGAVSTITPASNCELPAKAIVLGGTIDITTQLTSGGAATIAVGTSAGSSTTSLKGATAVASWTAGQLALVPVFTAATYVKLTAAGSITVTVATAALTAGKFDVNLVYIVGN